MANRSSIHSGVLALAVVTGCYDAPPDIRLAVSRQTGSYRLVLETCMAPLCACKAKTLLGPEVGNDQTWALYVDDRIETVVLAISEIMVTSYRQCVTVELGPDMLERAIDLRRLPDNPWSCPDGTACETPVDCPIMPACEQ